MPSPLCQPDVPAEVRQDLETLPCASAPTWPTPADFVNRFVEAIKLAEELKVSYEWKPDLKDWNQIFIARNGSKDATLVLHAELQAVSKFRPNRALPSRA
jgi:hypothetical protein